MKLAISSFVAAVLLGVTGVVASPLVGRENTLEERAAVVCKKPDYGPFRLYAAPVDPKIDWLPLSLRDLYTPRPTNDTISSLGYYTSPDFNRVPAYWTLKNKILSAVFTDAQAGWRTVNLAVTADSSVKFVTSDGVSILGHLAP
ncbi:hypothetical protein FRC17_005936, partial [Serendipita sp. 399]